MVVLGNKLLTKKFYYNCLFALQGFRYQHHLHFHEQACAKVNGNGMVMVRATTQASILIRPQIATLM